MVNLFYASNQTRQKVYNEQRKKDLINQLKQLEKIRAYNNQELYDEQMADKMAKLYANISDKTKSKKSFTDAFTQTMSDNATQTQSKTQPLMLEAPTETMMLDYPEMKPEMTQLIKSKSVGSQPSQSPSLIEELKSRINIDKEEKEKIDKMSRTEKFKFLRSKGENPGGNTSDYKLTMLAYKYLTKKNEKEPSGKGLIKKRTRQKKRIARIAL